MPDLTGGTIGCYQILEPLGEGGMATVYRAFDPELKREVAIKVIRRELFGELLLGQMQKRFEREVRSQAKLVHTNITRVLDFGEFQGAPYMVMQYIPGGTLKRFTGHPIFYRKAAELLAPIARALEYAHSQGIIHRDVKPGNILLTADGDPMLSDFGIAKVASDEGENTLTATGMGIGTPEYMAPEQADSRQVTPSVDIYALGVVLYELVTGRKPFEADTPLAVMHKHVYEEIPNPTTLVPDLLPEVEQVIRLALGKKPQERFRSMGDFALALECLARGLVIPASALVSPSTAKTNPAGFARDDGTVLRVPQPKRKWLPWAAGGAGAVLLLSLLIFAIIPAILRPYPTSTPTSNAVIQIPTFTLPVPETEAPSPVPTTVVVVEPSPIVAVSTWQQGSLALLIGSKTARDVYWMDLAGGADPLLLTSSDSKSRFLGTILSPDGLKIAWYDDFYAQTLQKEINGGQATVLANCTQPSFSPDGSHLICKGRDGYFQVVKTSDGSVQSRITTGVESSVLPAWSPTRQEIVFAGFDAERKTVIWRLDLGAGQAIPLAEANYENYAPSWSPDGEWIAFQSAEQGMPSEIWLMDREGGQQRKITFNSGWSRGPSFSPDGQWLAFVSDIAGSIGPDSGELFAISLVTGEQVQLTRTGGMVYDWRVSWGK